MRICFFIAAICCGLIATAQFPYNPLPFKQPDFKKIKELGHRKLVVYRQSEEEKNVAFIVEYEKNGNITAMFERGTNDNGDSINTSETYYEFDAKGRLIGMNTTEVDYGEARTLFTYDATGKLIRKQTATIDPPTYKYKYDAKGRLIEANVTQTMPAYEEDGEWKGKTVEKPSNRYLYKYDAKGRLSEEWDYKLPMETKSDPPSYKTIWTYNDKNQVIQVRRINSEKTEMYREDYEYNKDGLISKRVFNDGDEDEVYYYEYSK